MATPVNQGEQGNAVGGGRQPLSLPSVYRPTPGENTLEPKDFRAVEQVLSDL